MLALSRNIAPAYQSLIEGRWDRSKFMGTQVAGKTLGIVGLGRIGLAVAARAKGLEMRIIGYESLHDDRTSARSRHRTGRNGRPHAANGRLSNRPHTAKPMKHATCSTRPSSNSLSQGRGSSTALAVEFTTSKPSSQGLESGKLAGVALDVYPSEPCTDNRLFGMQGVVCTPHLGASTKEAQTSVATEAVELLTGFPHHRHHSPRGECHPARSQDARSIARLSRCCVSAGSFSCRIATERALWLPLTVPGRDCRS